MEYISTGLAASNALSEVSWALQVHFVEAIETTDFRADFNNDNLM